MGKVEEARDFLKMVGMPKSQQADICCYVLLAMADMKPDMSWEEASNEWIRIHDIIQFSNAFYGTTYAENSRETFRKPVSIIGAVCCLSIILHQSSGSKSM